MKLPKPLFARAYASVAVLLGKGDGTFQAAVDYGSGPSPVSLAVSDFNGDGMLDVAVGQSAPRACRCCRTPACSPALASPLSAALLLSPSPGRSRPQGSSWNPPRT